MSDLELLGPAGSIDAVYQAVHGGADSVYLGGADFGARAFAANFTYEQMKTAIDFCHLFDVKVFVTVNTLIYQDEIDAFLAHVKTIYELGADALIMQDIGMMSAVRQLFPDIEIHASTQMHNHNDASLKFVQSLGACRAVLAREMSIEQIGGLTCDIEKEVFVHGALCICYSGQCLFSALTENRSGNRGRCAQSCRMKYALVGSDGKHIADAYLLSPRDLGLFEDVGKLIDAGVTCFKIEGRMKSPEYVGLVTRMYAALLRGEEPAPQDYDNLTKLFNRGFTKGHLLGGDELMSTQRPNHKGVPLGRVSAVDKYRITIALGSELHQGDGVKFERTDTGFICNKIYLSGRLVSCAQSGDMIALDNKADANIGDSVVKTSDSVLIKALGNFEQKKIGISAELVAHKGERLELTLTDGTHTASAIGDIVAQSKTKPAGDLAENIGKLGDTPYVLDDIKVSRDADIFVAKSALNALRREATDALTQLRTALPSRKIASYTPPKTPHLPISSPKVHVLVRNEAQLDAIRDLDIGDIYVNDVSLYAKHPNTRLKTDRLAKDTPPMSDMRLLVSDTGGLHTYQNTNDFVLDYHLNALNARTLAVFFGLGAKRVALSPESSELQIADMVRAYETANGHPPVLEALVYGRYELMAMQHCVISHTLGKPKHCESCKSEQYYLHDIKNNRYPIVTDSNCNNYILSSKCENADIAKLCSLGVRDFRIELFDEDAAQSRAVVNGFISKVDLFNR